MRCTLYCKYRLALLAIASIKVADCKMASYNVIVLTDGDVCAECMCSLCACVYVIVQVCVSDGECVVCLCWVTHLDLLQLSPGV